MTTLNKSRPRIFALLIDLSGTLHIGDVPTPSAPLAIQRLREANVPFRFCSNTSKESKKDLCHGLKKMGFTLEPDQAEVWTSLGAVKESLKRRGSKRPYFLLSQSAQDEICESFPQEEPSSSRSPYDAVVIGYAPTAFNYHNLNTAFRILINKDQTSSDTAQSDPVRNVPIIATHQSKYLAQQDGNGTTNLSLGPGPFISALETAVGPGVEIEVVGKPSRSFFETVIGSFDGQWYEKEKETGGRIAIIGDDVEADLGGGALELGLWRVLVKTGKYRVGDEVRTGCQPPDEVCESFSSWVSDFLADPMLVRDID